MAPSEPQDHTPARPRKRSASSRPVKLVGLVGLAAAAIPLLIACNSLIGLSDFTKGECPGAICPDDGGFPDQMSVDGGVDSPSDAPDDVKGTDPVSWAKWPMPNYGEGGATEPPRPQKLTLSGGVVKDAVTGLTWRATIVPGDVLAADVVGTCAGLAPAGSWRAPKRIELVTLLDYSHITPFVDTTVFKDLRNFKVWTTSEVRPARPAGTPFVPTTNQAYWVVNFETGAVEPLSGDLDAKVLCVAAK